MANEFEARKRAEKVHDLCDAIDQHVAFAGLHAHADGMAIADMLSRWNAEQWASLSVSAGKRPPSAETVRLIVERYRQRAQRAS